MNRLKNVDGQILYDVGFLLVPLALLLDHRRERPVWIVMGCVGVLLAVLGLIKQFVELKQTR